MNLSIYMRTNTHTHYVNGIGCHKGGDLRREARIHMYTFGWMWGWVELQLRKFHGLGVGSWGKAQVMSWASTPSAVSLVTMVVRSDGCGSHVLISFLGSPKKGKIAYIPLGVLTGYCTLEFAQPWGTRRSSRDFGTQFSDKRKIGGRIGQFFPHCSWLT
jgi:hypothetical protein